MTNWEAQPLVDCKNELGEGVQWNQDHQRVFWTDIFGNALWSCDEDGNNVDALQLPAGLCAFAFQTPDRLIAAFTDGLCWLDLETGKREMIQPYMSDHPTTRMNDGGLDRQGRFIAGGIEEDSMAPVTPIWSVNGHGIREIIPNVGCANSLVFSPDGQTMYFADTAGADLFAYDYDTDTGTPSNKRFFARIDEEGGKPDGSTVDAEGYVWNARFGGGRVQRFSPAGEPAGAIHLPVPNVTCCAIGGADLDRMFITTARLLMSDAELEAEPTAGGLFVAPSPAKGLPAGRYHSTT